MALPGSTRPAVCASIPASDPWTRGLTSTSGLYLYLWPLASGLGRAVGITLRPSTGRASRQPDPRLQLPLCDVRDHDWTGTPAAQEGRPVPGRRPDRGPIADRVPAGDRAACGRAGNIRIRGNLAAVRSPTRNISPDEYLNPAGNADTPCNVRKAGGCSTLCPFHCPGRHRPGQ